MCIMLFYEVAFISIKSCSENREKLEYNRIYSWYLVGDLSLSDPVDSMKNSKYLVAAYLTE